MSQGVNCCMDTCKLFSAEEIVEIHITRFSSFRFYPLFILRVVIQETERDSREIGVL